MPLDQHIEGGHGEGEACLERRPDSVRHLFEMEHHRQLGEHRLHQHPVLPLTALTEFQVGGIAFRRMESGITQDNHLFFKLPNQPLKGVIDVSTTILSSRHCLLDSCGITYLLC